MFTTTQRESVTINHGLVYLNYGETDQRQLGPCRGGSAFNATKNIRDIEFDGRLGKTKGMQVIDEINAILKVVLLDASLETLALVLPQANYDSVAKVIKSGVGGVIPDTKYIKNVTMFARTVSGKYKRITLFNALAENDFTLEAKPKSEGEITLEFHAHWDTTADPVEGGLYTIEDIDAIAPPPAA